MPEQLRFELDPELGPIRARLVSIWTDVSNAGGSVGFVPTVTTNDIEAVATQAFGYVQSGHGHLIVAYEGEEPIGFGFLDHRPGPLFQHWATIKRLQIHPDMQGRGYGTALLVACEEFAKELSIEEVHLTARGGTGTEAFYERVGYAIVARIPGVIRVAPGDDRDEIYLIKKL